MIRTIDWCHEAEYHIRRALSEAATEYSKCEVMNGISQLWECQDGDLGGYMVTRLELTDGRLEWVWVACGGTGFMHFARQFMEVARAHGVDVRAHVNRPGLVRMYERLGFNYSETVMRLPIDRVTH